MTPQILAFEYQRPIMFFINPESDFIKSSDENFGRFKTPQVKPLSQIKNPEDLNKEIDFIQGKINETDEKIKNLPHKLHPFLTNPYNYGSTSKFRNPNKIPCGDKKINALQLRISALEKDYLAESSPIKKHYILKRIHKLCHNQDSIAHNLINYRNWLSCIILEKKGQLQELKAKRVNINGCMVLNTREVLEKSEQVKYLQIKLDDYNREVNGKESDSNYKFSIHMQQNKIIEIYNEIRNYYSQIDELMKTTCDDIIDRSFTKYSNEKVFKEINSINKLIIEKCQILYYKYGIEIDLIRHYQKLVQKELNRCQLELDQLCSKAEESLDVVGRESFEFPENLFQQEDPILEDYIEEEKDNEVFNEERPLLAKEIKEKKKSKLYNLVTSTLFRKRNKLNEKKPERFFA